MAKASKTKTQRERTREARAKRHKKTIETTVKAVRSSIERGLRLRIIGGHGIGKTSMVLDIVKQEGLTPVYFSLATTSPSDMVVPVPVLSRVLGDPRADDSEFVRQLRAVLIERLMTDEEKVIIFDEYSRAPRPTLAAAMNVVAQGRLGGVKIPNLKTVIALDNPEDGTYSVTGLDVPQAARFVTMVVTQADIPWREALERKYKDEIDQERLEDLWDVHAEFNDPNVWHAVPPRVIDHMISNALDGIPIDWALPLDGRERSRIIDSAGQDVTVDVLSRIAGCIGGALSSELDAKHGIKFDVAGPVAVKSAIKRGVNLHLVGDQGIGKSAYIEALAQPGNGVVDEGIRVVTLDAGQLSPEDLGVPVPVTVKSDDGEERSFLEFLVYEHFVDPTPFVLVLDEFSRASIRTKNALMEIIQQRTLCGIPIPGLRCTIALDNPSGSVIPSSAQGKEGDAVQAANALMYSVGAIDLAQATRFPMIVSLRSTDIPWNEYLHEKYGDVAAPFIDWWFGNLDTAQRILCAPRTLEQMIQLHMDGLDIEMAIPMVGNKRLPVSLGLLRHALRGKEIVGFADLVENTEYWCDRLDEGDPEAHAQVQRIFQSADPVRLKENKDVVIKLCEHLDEQRHMALLATRDHLEFWVEVIRDAKNNRRARAAQAAGDGS